MPSVSDPPRSHRAGSAAVVFLGLLSALQLADPVIASLALVQATKALALTPDTQALAAAISTLALAATVVPSGVVADIIGRRRLIIAALVLTAAGDLLAAAAPGAIAFMVGRAIAGVGLGAVFAGSFGFVRSVVTPATLPAALGVFTAVGSIPLFVLMPLSTAVAGASWRAAFVVVPALALAAAAVSRRLLPDLAPLPPARRDYRGLTALGVGIVLLLVGISRSASGPANPDAWVPVLLGLAGLGLFLLAEARSRHPVFPVGLLRNPIFLAGAVGGFAWNAATAVAQLLSSNLWQYVLGLSALAASLRQLPMMLFTVIAAFLAGWLMGRGRPSVAVLVWGGVLTTAGLAGAALLSHDSGGLPFLGALCLALFGAGVMTVPQAHMFVDEAPEAFYGPVTSSRTCVGQVAYAVGLAGGAAIASLVTVSRLLSEAGLSEAGLSEAGLSEAGLSEAEASAAVGSFLVGADPGGIAVGAAYADGFAAAMWAFAALVAVCTVVVAGLGRRRTRQRQNR